MGFNNAKTLAYMAAGLAHIADLMLAQKWREAEDLTLALFVAVDQATINDGKCKAAEIGLAPRFASRRVSPAPWAIPNLGRHFFRVAFLLQQ